MLRKLSVLLLLTTLACASGQSSRPANIPQPELDAGLVSPLFFGSGTTAAATIAVRARNRSTVPITVRRIEVDAPGMGQYTLGRAVRDYRDTLAPGEAKEMTVFATAYAQTTRRPTEPLQLRVIVEFESGEARWREVLMTRE